MLHRLSLAWGVPLEQLENTLSAHELRRWCLYYQIEPWGSEVTDHWGQTLAYTVAQTQSTTRLDPADFAAPWRRAAAEKLVPFEVGQAALIEHLKRGQKR